ncbi:MAG: hypothetical protein ACRDJG_12695, partial [Actinomycetota bacterium]
MRRCSPPTSSRPHPAPSLLPPFALRPALPASDYYGGSAPPRGHRRTMRLPFAGRAGRAAGDGSRVHCRPVDGEGSS